jgi:hypothetical protein
MKKALAAPARRVLAIVLAIVFISSGFAAYARASDHISSYTIALVPLGNGVIRVAVSIHGTHPNMTRIGFPSIALYERNGNNWTLVASRSSQFSPTISGSHVFSFEFQGKPGVRYYAFSSYLAQDALGHDLRSVTSPELIAT